MDPKFRVDCHLKCACIAWFLWMLRAASYFAGVSLVYSPPSRSFPQRTKACTDALSIAPDGTMWHAHNGPFILCTT